jgi:hypothetical protein
VTQHLLHAVNHACTVSDSVRQTLPFSNDLRAASSDIWAAKDDADAAQALRTWLTSHQPCLFGRIAAKNNLLSYCIVSETDLARGDDWVFGKIQNARLGWRQEAVRGEKHGFILLLASERLAGAMPSDSLAQVALRFGTLYLEEELSADRVHLEHLFMSSPSANGDVVHMWPAGVNVFCAQGDGRWWADHRVPGGIAFSVNSVGHMVKSAKWRAEYGRYAEGLSLPALVGPKGPRVDSLEMALALAIGTINNAQDTVSGKATILHSRDDHDTVTVKGHDSVSASSYTGYYHTDYTVPTLYFRPDVARPSDAAQLSLDFTYLHKPSVANIDSYRIGQGTRVRADSSTPAERLVGRLVTDLTDPKLRRILGLS